MNQGPADHPAGGRVLALDYGKAQTGVAVSDPSGVIVRPLPAIRDASGKQGLEMIARLVMEEAAVKVVVGMPVSLSGEMGSQALETTRFLETIRTLLDVPVIAWDERFTSKIARERGREAAASEHSVAACCLLEDYLRSEENQRHR